MLNERPTRYQNIKYQGAFVNFIKKLEFGNYTLNFGENKVLLDLFNEVVMPSFIEMKHVRRLKEKGEYFFWIQN